MSLSFTVSSSSESIVKSFFRGISMLSVELVLTSSQNTMSSFGFSKDVSLPTIETTINNEKFTNTEQGRFNLMKTSKTRKRELSNLKFRSQSRPRHCLVLWSHFHWNHLQHLIQTCCRHYCRFLLFSTIDFLKDILQFKSVINKRK